MVDREIDNSRSSMIRVGQATAILVAATIVIAAGCGSSSNPNRAATTVAGDGNRVAVVAGENEYGDVAAQIGGGYVTVYSVDSNPNTDPHTYEATPAVARKIAQAKVLIENGVGYDDFVSKLASASPNRARRVIDVQHLLGLPDSTPNPHLWYDPKTMPAAAQALVSDLSALDPAHASAFQANETRFVMSLQPWLGAIASFKAKYQGTTAATTEPVADYLLTAMGIVNLSPFGFQADIMNGTDPSPQGVSLEKSFITRHQAKVFCYNEQVTDALTDSIRQAAVKAGVPVVAVYETMPTPGFDYQSWMMAEVSAVAAAITSGTSTQHL
jgi:zinc/manganese transport system substrate-binding protein